MASRSDPSRLRSASGHGADRGARQVVQIAPDCVKDRSGAARICRRGGFVGLERNVPVPESRRAGAARVRRLGGFLALRRPAPIDPRAAGGGGLFRSFPSLRRPQVARRSAMRRREPRRGRVDRRSDHCAAGVSPGERRRLAQASGSRDDVPRPLRRGGRAARHQARRRDPVRPTARSFHQGRARHRGPPLLRPFRHRRGRHAARLDRQRPRRRRRAGRLLDHPAARQEPVSDQRALDFAQDQRSLPCAVARAPSHQEANPQPLSRSRLHGRRRVRRAGGGAILFRQVGARHQSRRGRHARRPVQGADEIFPGRQSARRARQGQRRPEQSRRRRLHDRGPSLRRAAQSRHARSRRTPAPAPIGIWISPTTR